MQVIEVAIPPSPARTYPLYIGEGILSKVGEFCRNRNLTGRILVVTDRKVAKLYGEIVRRSFQAAAIPVEFLILPPGERQKSARSLWKIYDRLVEGGYERGDTILALGGGVIGDLGGFAAATYMRGIPWAAVPTTLLAQVDASVGGKTGINHPRGKNLIGAFHQPQFVLADLSTLQTLPPREWRSGMAEVIKAALIGDPELFALLEGQKDLRRLSFDLLERVVSRACRLKARIVMQDERESGLRRILNFGHTTGHALEALTRYRILRHGEAVILGMRVALRLSRMKGLLPQSSFSRAEALLHRLFPRPPRLTLPPQVVWDQIRLDKKVRNNCPHFILLQDIGQPVIRHDVTQEEFAKALAAVIGGTP